MNKTLMLSLYSLSHLCDEINTAAFITVTAESHIWYPQTLGNIQ